MAALSVTRSFLATSLIFSFMRSGSFSRGRSENFLVEMEGGIGNKESWQDKTILKIEQLCLHAFYIYACFVSIGVEMSECAFWVFCSSGWFKNIPPNS